MRIVKEVSGKKYFRVFLIGTFETFHLYKLPLMTYINYGLVKVHDISIKFHGKINVYIL
jgi:hypothetical protein